MKWVTDHMEDSEEHTHKPLLLEEFGKIVWEKDFVKVGPGLCKASPPGLLSREASRKQSN